MCQYNNSEYTTGDKPLTCWKFLLWKDKTIVSPYYFTYHWTVGKTHHAENFTSSGIKSFGISKGFLHAFINKTSLHKEMIRFRSTYPNCNIIIAEMEIPPHTTCYIGDYDVIKDSIASEQMLFKKVLNFFPGEPNVSDK